MIKAAKNILIDVFGYETFRPLQQDIVGNILKRRDTLVIMPTGAGKSICYQIPALIFKGLTVVVSPLISLMKDQVEQLTELGIDAIVLNSTLSPHEYRKNTERIRKNHVRLLYVAPETLLMQRTLSLLSSTLVDALIIDEAHCISEWGHDFRPEYRQLVEVRKQFPDAVCAAFTATATPRVQQDIKESLCFENANAFIASFDRKNLFLEIIPKLEPIEQTLQFLQRFKNQSGIIYCFSRRQVDELTGLMTNEGYQVHAYHAGLSDEERHRNQERFIRDDVQIIVATIAFGMGINKPNIRFVLHYDLPKNIESYYQQIGRAGRDGLPATCQLLFGYADIQKIRHFIDQKDESEKRIANMHLNALVGFAETDACRRAPLLQYFGEDYSDSNCQKCDNCLTGDRPKNDLTIPAQKFLSCIKRTGELFGAAHIIDVLRGSQAKKVLKFSHHKHSTYGIGMDYSKQNWHYLSRQFLQKGLVRQDETHGSLKLTKKGWAVLRGEELFFGRIRFEMASPMSFQTGIENYDQQLFELLRQKRKLIADHANIPPYVIFPDKTLMEMAIYFPQSRENFMQMYGVGAVKFEKYGNAFLDLIHGYCQKKHIKEKTKWRSHSRTSKMHAVKKPRFILVGESFNAGESLKDLQKKYNVQIGTILTHLYTYLQHGHSLSRSQELPELSKVTSDVRESVFKAFDTLGTERLRPVFDAMEGQVDFEDLHLLRLVYLIEKVEDKF